jgi:DNA-binding XRE family transcriptional regulator
MIMAQENKISKNTKKLRQNNGLSQDRLSKAADVSYNSIIKLGTSGIIIPTINTLQKIAKMLDVSVDDLIK